MITITWISVKMYVIGVPFHVGGNVNIKLVHYLFAFLQVKFI